MFEKITKQLRFVGTLGFVIGEISLTNIELGKAEYYYKGPYKNSCPHCGWINAGFTYRCMCKNNAGELVESTVPEGGVQALNWDLYNCNGALKFNSCNP
jgi:hypothetical protein